MFIVKEVKKIRHKEYRSQVNFLMIKFLGCNIIKSESENRCYYSAF